MGGGLLHLSIDLADGLLASLRRAREGAEAEGERLARELSVELGGLLDDTAVLRRAPPLITGAFLADLLETSPEPRSPEFVNSDGEALSAVLVHYGLLPGVRAEAVVDVLDGQPDLRPTSEVSWSWLSPDPGPAVPDPMHGDFALLSSLDDGSVVLGTVELQEDALVLSVNSEERAQRGMAMLAPPLEGMVREPLVERRGAMDEAGEDEAAEEIPPEDERLVVHALLDRHYREQLDQPIPALGDVSPRRAVGSAEGRERVAAWLKRMENQMARHEPGSPMREYDVAWLWEELGVADLRR